MDTRIFAIARLNSATESVDPMNLSFKLLRGNCARHFKSHLLPEPYAGLVGFNGNQRDAIDSLRGHPTLKGAVKVCAQPLAALRWG